MKILLSWSGERSKELALALYKWIPIVIQSVEPWMSEPDIDIGSRWGLDLDRELEQNDFGILCLTPECISSTWIHYEAGAISKFVDKSHVCPYLLDLQLTDIKGPLVNFQAARANREDTLKLMQTINNSTNISLPEKRKRSFFSDEKLQLTFNKFWPDLESDLAKIAKIDTNNKKSSRTLPDMVDEILQMVREHSRVLSDIQTQLATSDDRSVASARNCVLPAGIRMCKLASKIGNFKIIYAPKDLDDDEKMIQISKNFGLVLDKNPDITFGKKCYDVLEDTAAKSGFKGKIIRILE